MDTSAGEVIHNAVIVCGDEEWEGLYVDDVLAVESHSLSGGQYAHALAGKAVRFVERITVDDVWLEDFGRLPLELRSIPLSAVVRRKRFGP